MNNDTDTKNNSTKGSNANLVLSFLVTLIVIGLIIGFIISLVKHTYWLTVVTAGCFLLSLDSILFMSELEKKRKRSFVFPFIILFVGICTVICGIILKADPESFKRIALKYAPYAVLLLFVLIGLLLIVSAFTEPKRMLRYCTEKVTGVCVDYKMSISANSNRNMSRAPVYEFSYNGETRRIAESTFSNFANPQIGDEREIYIDAESLDEVYEPIRAAKLSKFTCLIGMLFAAAALFGLVMTLILR